MRARHEGAQALHQHHRATAVDGRHLALDDRAPQLYSSGGEEQPEYVAEDAHRNVDYSHWQNAKAKFVPSVVSTNGIDDMKDFFASKGLHVDGFVQWGQVAADLPSWGQTVDDDACRAHGFCDKSKQISK